MIKLTVIISIIVPSREEAISRIYCPAAGQPPHEQPQETVAEDGEEGRTGTDGGESAGDDDGLSHFISGLELYLASFDATVRLIKPHSSSDCHRPSGQRRMTAPAPVCKVAD